MGGDRLQIRRRLLILGIAIVALSAAIATQYARMSIGYEFTVVHPAEGLIRFVGYDNSSADGVRLLRIENNATNPTLKLYFGDIPKGMNKTYTAAFAIVNEEDFPVNIVGINVDGTGANYIQVWLHADATKKANDDTSVLLWNKGTGWAGGTAWTLAKGDGDTSTMNGGVTDTPWDSTASIRYADSTPVATSGSTDFVWVQISIDTSGISSWSSPTSYTGSIEFEFEAVTT